MAKRAHIWEDDQEYKWCPACEKYILVLKFHTVNNRTWDNRFHICIECTNKRRRNKPRLNAFRTFKDIIKRVETYPSYKKRKVELRISERDFIIWYEKNWFPRCRVDRINNEGHYELSNIQLLTQNEHNAKARQDRLDFLGIVEPEGKRYCYTCESIKLHKEFYTKKRKISAWNPLGLDETCKQCSREKRMKYYYENKEKANAQNNAL